MKYDDEYNTFKFNNKDMEIIINALYYYSRNDVSINEFDSNYVNGLIKSLGLVLAGGPIRED
jgi:hypothetical protein